MKFAFFLIWWDSDLDLLHPCCRESLGHNCQNVEPNVLTNFQKKREKNKILPLFHQHAMQFRHLAVKFRQQHPDLGLRVASWGASGCFKRMTWCYCCSGRMTRIFQKDWCHFTAFTKCTFMLCWETSFTGQMCWVKFWAPPRGWKTVC